MPDASAIGPCGVVVGQWPCARTTGHDGIHAASHEFASKQDDQSKRARASGPPLRRQRWWLLVKDVNGRVIYNRAFFFRSSAERQGGWLNTPPLTTYEVRRG